MIVKCLRSIGYWFKDYWQDILSVVITVVLIFAAFFGGFFLCWSEARDQVMFWEAMTTAVEPEYCSLCGTDKRVKYHAPCLVNLSSGEIAELSVYEPHPTIAGEVSDEIKTGYFGYSYAAGANMIQMPGLEKCVAALSKEAEILNAEHFCYDCRRMLSSVDKEGYVIVDLYDDEAIGVYKVYDGAKYTIRDYIVTVHKNENRRLVVEVHGNIDK